MSLLDPKKWLEIFGPNYRGEVKVVKVTEFGEEVVRLKSKTIPCGFLHLGCTKGRTYDQHRRMGKPSQFKTFRGLTSDPNMVVLLCETCGLRTHVRVEDLFQ